MKNKYQKFFSKKIKNFTYEEFVGNADSRLLGMVDFKDVEEFSYKLQEARLLAGLPFKVNSWYRDILYNRKVGGVPNSSHLKGIAVDIACKDSNSRMIIITSLFLAGFKRIGIAKTFIHVDLDGEKDNEVIRLYE